MTKRMADGLKTALQQALQMEKSATREDWAEVYLEQIDELKPKWKTVTVPPDFYGPEELRAMGITCGDGSMMHRQSIVVNPRRLTIGKNSRVDGFCTISCGSGIHIGDNCHIAGYVSLMGGAGIEIGDYCSIASGSKIFSVSDDVMGRGLVGPQVPESKRYLYKGKVTMQPHSVLTIGAMMMPGSVLSKGSTVMTYSMYVERSPGRDFAVYAGTPACYIKDKKPELKKLVEETENE
jgi:acetyltransferase-like isoleucine patch superfamily enzyme